MYLKKVKLCLLILAALAGIPMFLLGFIFEFYFGYFRRGRGHLERTMEQLKDR